MPTEPSMDRDPPAMVWEVLPEPTMDDVERVVRRDYGHLPFERVMQVLRGYRNPFDHETEPPYRIWLGILKVSGGEERRLNDYVDLANTDYRDLLMNAEYAKQGNIGSWTNRRDPNAMRRAKWQDHCEYIAWLRGEEPPPPLP